MLAAFLLLITVLLAVTPQAAWSPSPSHPGRGAPEAQEGWTPHRSATFSCDRLGER
jgi:hypothetical protein